MPIGFHIYRILTMSLPVYTWIKIKQAQKQPPKHDE